MSLLYQTHAVVHLGNIRRNLEGVMARTKKPVLLAVKANAYGHGAIEVSLLAQKTGVSSLGVATIPEGMELRRAGISLPILKFSPAFPVEMKEAVSQKIALTICEEGNAALLEEAVKAQRAIHPVHIKVDTGMGRIGVSPAGAPGLCSFIVKYCPHLKIEGVYTHFPSSDNPDQELYTQKQIGIFQNCVQVIEKTLNAKIPLVHAANSGGILSHPESYLDLVRPGIMAYGFYPDERTPRTVPLYPGLSFYTRISFIKQVSTETPISYGHTWRAPQEGFVATIPAGYADGFNRLFSNKGRVLIGGKSYPVVGRVCMDQSLIFLGGDRYEIGERVTLIGRDGSEEITAYEWAKKLDTITYEVTCQINSRVQRVFEET